MNRINYGSGRRLWRGSAALLILALTTALWGFPAQGAAKAEGWLTAVPRFVLPYTEQGFPLSALEARSPAGDEARLTYSVESGGDVIRVEGDHVRITGVGDARIRIFADETANYRAGETQVDIHIFRKPEIQVALAEDESGMWRLHVSLDPGSYGLEELTDWRFSYRRAGEVSYTPLSVEPPPVFPFYILTGRLSPDTAYEFLVTATAPDHMDSAGGDVSLSSHCLLHTPMASGGGSVSGTVSGGGGQVQVSLLSGGVIYGGERPGPGGVFTFRGVPDGVYQLVAEGNGTTITSSVEVRDGEQLTESQLLLGGPGTFVDVLGDDTPPLTVAGLDALPEKDGAEPGEGRLEYHFVAAKAGGAPLGQEAVRAAADVSETIGLYLDLALRRLRLDEMDRALEETFLEELDGELVIAVQLPEELRGMDGYRVLVCGEEAFSPLACRYQPEDGTLRFSTRTLSTVVLLYQHPDRGTGGVGGGDSPPVGDGDAVTAMAPPPLPTEPPSLDMSISPWMIVAAVLLALIVSVFIARRLVALPRQPNGEQPPSPEPELPEEPEEQETETEPEPEAVEEPKAPPPRKGKPADDHRFFDGIEERRELRLRLLSGEITQEEFRELEKEILLRM